MVENISICASPLKVDASRLAPAASRMHVTLPTLAIDVGSFRVVAHSFGVEATGKAAEWSVSVALGATETLVKSTSVAYAREL